MSHEHLGGIAYPSRARALTLHLSIGADLLYLEVDAGDLGLREVSRLALPAPVQYAWPHPARNLLYVASSNRPVSRADDLHTLSTVEVNDESGAMRVIGQAALPTRPIHLTITPDGRHVLVVYNAPGGITVHRVDGTSGAAGQALEQPLAPGAGIFPHQVLVLPSGEAAVVVARGNHGRTPGSDEPGSLEFVRLEGDMLRGVATVSRSPEFGPRHLDFHPSGRWAAISVERHNELHVFEVRSDRFAAQASHRVSTLERPSPSGHDQLSGTIRFHPNGRYLYVINRNDTAVYGNANEPSLYEGNNVAVYAFDEATGRPEPLQHIPTESIHVRTFSFDATGRLLVAASILPGTARVGGKLQTLPARLTFYRVGDDGRLALARVQDMPAGPSSMFWSRLNGALRPLPA